MILPIESEFELAEGVKEYYQAIDFVVNQLSTGKEIACKSNCSFCCHLHITLKPYELLALVRHVESLSRVERVEIESVIDQNRQLLAETSDSELLAVNFSCPFLNDGTCLVYSVRPLSCRAAHSRSKLVCEQAYCYPHSEIEADHLPELTESIRAIEDEFEEVLGEYYDVSDYNMNESLNEALGDSTWVERFIAGDEVFSDAALSRV